MGFRKTMHIFCVSCIISHRTTKWNQLIILIIIFYKMYVILGLQGNGLVSYSEIDLWLLFQGDIYFQLHAFNTFSLQLYIFSEGPRIDDAVDTDLIVWRVEEVLKYNFLELWGSTYTPGDSLCRCMLMQNNFYILIRNFYFYKMTVLKDK